MILLDPQGHLASDESATELHAFAARIGLRRAWFQDKRIPHYDLTGGKLRLALAAGAESVSSRELVRRCRQEREEAASR